MLTFSYRELSREWYFNALFDHFMQCSPLIRLPNLRNLNWRRRMQIQSGYFLDVAACANLEERAHCADDVGSDLRSHAKALSHTVADRVLRKIVFGGPNAVAFTGVKPTSRTKDKKPHRHVHDYWPRGCFLDPCHGHASDPRSHRNCFCAFVVVAQQNRPEIRLRSSGTGWTQLSEWMDYVTCVWFRCRRWYSLVEVIVGLMLYLRMMKPPPSSIADKDHHNILHCTLHITHRHTDIHTQGYTNRTKDCLNIFGRKHSEGVLYICG